MNIRRIQLVLVTLFIGLSLSAAMSKVTNADTPWDTIKTKNHFVLIRHALAPGYSDPTNFNLRDCATQRNLNDEGRLQAKKIGQLFKQFGINTANVYSSQWCRCLETARLLDLGAVFELPALNSFFENFEQRDTQTMDFMRWIRDTPLDKPTILVSHQVNIAAITGYSPASGEIVFVRKDKNGTLKVINTLPTLY
jgi:broad specificity phosphatase PhoE